MSKTVAWREVQAESLSDVAYQERWEATALAREVANFVVRFRAEQGLSQTALARRLGMTQSQVSRLEDGEHEPRLATLRRLSAQLGMRLRLSVQGVVGEDGTAASQVEVVVG